MTEGRAGRPTTSQSWGAGQKRAPGKNSFTLTGAAFVLAAQPVDEPKKNDPGYGARVSGAMLCNYFRSYSPSTGRYSQPDPIGLDGGWNLFEYVDGNSLQRSDPLGLWSIDAGGFWGPGMNFTLGYDAGLRRGFFGMQFGYGVGGGIMYSPDGGLPTGQGPLTKCRDDQMFMELFGKAGVSGIGANVDIVTANAGKGLTTGRPYGGLSWFEFSFGKKWGLKAEAAGGVQLMGVTRPNSNESCSCR